MNRKSSHLRERHGSIIVLTAVSLVILLIFAALLVDVAWMSSIQSEAQLATDISARGALTAFVNDRSTDSYDVRVARAQAIGETLFENTVVGRDPLDVDPKSFVFGFRDENGVFTESNSGFANSVRLDLPNVKSDGFGLFLAPLFGVDMFNTSPSSTAAYDPIDLILCLDISRSMARSVGSGSLPANITSVDLPPGEGSRWLALVDSVNLFLEEAENQAPSLRIALVTFGGGEKRRVDTPWDGDPTRLQNVFDFIGANRDDIDASLDFISSHPLGINTPIKEAIELTQTVFQQNSSNTSNKICILLSDGRPTSGSPIAATTKLAQDDVTIHTIYFSGGDTAGRDQLEAIANEGGGLALNADNEGQLDQAFNRILKLLSVSIVE